MIIGVGNPIRHDDGFGPAVVEFLSEQRSIEHLDFVILDGEPTRVVEQWDHRKLAVVIDAVCAGSTPGTSHRLEIGLDAIPIRDTAPSSHTTGLAEAIALATALDRLPQRLVLLGVEPGDVSLGPGLTPAVEASVASVAAQALDEVHAIEDQRPGDRS